MRKTNKNRVRELEKRKISLLRNIELCESYKKQILNFAENLNEQYDKGLISYNKYYERLNSAFKQRTPQQWINLYDDYTDYYRKHLDICNEEIRNEERKAKAVTITPILITVILLIALGSLVPFFIKPVIIGFVTVEEASIQTYTQNISLVVKENSSYEWQPEQIGELTSVRVFGKIIGAGEVKIYLEDKLILDSSKLEKTKANKITGQVISDTDNVSTNEEIIANTTLTENKSTLDTINLTLAYGSSVNFDTDNDGIETLSGVIDFIINSKFNLDVNYNNLCTKWKVTSLDKLETTSLCYGNSECCSKFGLLPTFDIWNETFNLYYNRYGSTNNNLVSAQVFYYNKEDNSFIRGIESSLPAEFKEDVIGFSFECIETCNIILNKSSYQLTFEVENATLILDSIVYSIKEYLRENITQNITIPLPENVTKLENVTENITLLPINITEEFEIIETFTVNETNVLNLSEPLHPIVKIKKDKEGKEKERVKIYNITGDRKDNPELPKHWFIKDYTNVEQKDSYEDLVSYLISYYNNQLIYNLEKSAEFSQNTSTLYKACSTHIFNASLTTSSAPSNLTFAIVYKHDTKQNCGCNLIAGISAEVLFSDGTSDTTYTVGISPNGGIEADTNFVSENLSDKWVKVTAWPQNYDNFNLTDKLVSFCIVPNCDCGNLVVKEFEVETS